MGGSGGTSQSVSTQSYIENGKRVTRTEKTTTDRNGNTTTEVTEQTDDGRGNTTQNTYMIEGDTSGGGGMSSNQMIDNGGQQRIKKSKTQ